MAEQVWDLQCSFPGWEQGTVAGSNSISPRQDAGGLEEGEVKDLGSPIAAVARHPRRVAENSDSFEELFPNEQEDVEVRRARHSHHLPCMYSTVCFMEQFTGWGSRHCRVYPELD